MRSAVLAPLLLCACADILGIDRYASGHAGGGGATTVGTGGGTAGNASAIASTSATGGAGGMPTSYSDAILALDPIAYWRLGESTANVAVDAANDFDANYLGGYTLGEVGLIAGDVDTAVRMDGTGYLVVSDQFDFLGMSSFTLELWVSADDPATETVLFDKLELTPCNGYRFLFDATEVRFMRCNEDALDYVDATANLVMAEPTHLAARYDSSAQEMCIFINGSPDCNPSVQALPDTTKSLGLVYGLQGVVDEIAIYGEALATSVIEDHYILGTTQ